MVPMKYILLALAAVGYFSKFSGLKDYEISSIGYCQLI